MNSPTPRNTGYQTRSLSKVLRQQLVEEEVEDSFPVPVIKETWSLALTAGDPLGNGEMPEDRVTIKMEMEYSDDVRLPPDQFEDQDPLEQALEKLTTEVRNRKVEMGLVMEENEGLKAYLQESNVLNLTEEVASLKQTVEEYKGRIEELDEELYSSKKTEERLRNASEKRNKRLKALQTELKKHKSGSSETASELQRLRQAVQEKERRITQLVEGSMAKSKQIDKLNQEVQKWKDEATLAKGQCQGLKSKLDKKITPPDGKLGDVVRSLEGQMKGLLAENERLKKELNVMTQKKIELNEQMDQALNPIVTEKDELIKKLEQEVEKWQLGAKKIKEESDTLKISLEESKGQEKKLRTELSFVKCKMAKTNSVENENQKEETLTRE